MKILPQIKKLLRLESPAAVLRRPAQLVIVQGPQQFLAVSAVLAHQREVEGAFPGPRFAVIGSFYSSPEQSAKMKAACVEIAALGGFELIDALEIEQGLRRRKLSFDRAVRRLRSRLGDMRIEVVYVARNGQSLNELGLAAAGDEARRIVYGDGLGFLELDNSWGEPTYNPRGYLPIQEAWLTTPVEQQPNRFNRMRIVTVPAGHYVASLQALGERVEVLRHLRRELQAQTGGAPVVLGLAGQLTEASVVGRVEDEVAVYCQTAVPLLSAEDQVLIKAHPRATLRQAERLAESLRAHGLRATATDLGSEWPAEILGTLLPIQRIHSFCSYAGIMLAWQQRCPTQVGLDYGAMERFFPAAQMTPWCQFYGTVKSLVRQAFARQFLPIDFAEATRDLPDTRETTELLRPSSDNIPHEVSRP